MMSNIYVGNRTVTFLFRLFVERLVSGDAGVMVEQLKTFRFEKEMRAKSSYSSGERI